MSLFVLTVAVASAIKVKRVVGNGKIEQFPNHRLDLLNAGVAKFHYFFTVNANKVVMLFIAVGFFVVGYILPKLVFGNQIGGNQKF